MYYTSNCALAKRRACRECALEKGTSAATTIFPFGPSRHNAFSAGKTTILLRCVFICSLWVYQYPPLSFTLQQVKPLHTLAATYTR